MHQGVTVLLAAAPVEDETVCCDVAFCSGEGVARGACVPAELVPCDVPFVACCGVAVLVELVCDGWPPACGVELPPDVPVDVALLFGAFAPDPAPVPSDPPEALKPVALDELLVSPVGAPPRSVPFPYAPPPLALVSPCDAVAWPEDDCVAEVDVPVAIGEVPELVPVDVLTGCVFGGIVNGFCTVATCSFGDQVGSLVGTMALDPDAGAAVSLPDPGDDRCPPPVELELSAGWAAARASVCQRGESPKIMNHA